MRAAIETDVDVIADLAVAAGLFDRDERHLVVSLVDHHVGGAESPDVCLVDDLDGVVVGVAYAQPREATDRLWELTMLAVDPGRQRTGSGSRLLRAVEERLRSAGARLLLVETSALPTYGPARAFYARAGYVQVAGIVDYWQDGDDLVVFSKRLT